jgi:hypothetical protein
MSRNNKGIPRPPRKEYTCGGKGHPTKEQKLIHQKAINDRFYEQPRLKSPPTTLPYRPATQPGKWAIGDEEKNCTFRPRPMTARSRELMKGRPHFWASTDAEANPRKKYPHLDNVAKQTSKWMANKQRMPPLIAGVHTFRPDMSATLGHRNDDEADLAVIDYAVSDDERSSSLRRRLRQQLGLAVDEGDDCKDDGGNDNGGVGDVDDDADDEEKVEQKESSTHQSARKRHEADAKTIAALQQELAAARQAAGASTVPKQLGIDVDVDVGHVDIVDKGEMRDVLLSPSAYRLRPAPGELNDEDEV